MPEQSNVKKFWGLLLGLYTVATLLNGILTSFPYAAGKMFVPIVIGAGLLRWASSTGAVRNIYIGTMLLVIYFLFQDYNDIRRQIISDISYECVNNNASVDSTVGSGQQELEYCGCMAEELANLMMLRAVQHRFSSNDDELTADEFSKDTEMKAKMASARKICSVRVSG